MKRIRCFETGKVYASQAEAARSYKLSPAAISIAKKTGRAAGGVHWHDADKTPDPETFAKRRSKKRGLAPVVCCETGEVFESIRLAARSKGIRPATLTAAIDGTAGGYHWKRTNVGIQQEER